MNGVSGMGLSIRGSYLIGKIRGFCGICGKVWLPVRRDGAGLRTGSILLL